MKKLLFILLALAAATCGAKAQHPARVPAYPGVIERIQPNGDTLHVFLRGDEHWHFMMTVDGWEVKENDKGWICYCKLKTRKIDGEKKLVAVPTCRKAHDAAKRSKCEQRWLNRRGILKIHKD
ncbi:MAG: hypothetical protein IJT12_04210 [Paludibacteraceae bacterium]|nr:hypothetical protein [Paludibacteraceae bacterium]